jgi:hypothetical protein
MRAAPQSGSVAGTSNEESLQTSACESSVPTPNHAN